MKKDFFKNKKGLIVVLMTILLLSLIGLCSWGIPVLLEQTQNNSPSVEQENNIAVESITETDENEKLYNQENGLMDFIKVTYNDYNGQNYSFTLDNENIEEIKIGKQISTQDYVYTYGYYWTENDAKVVPKDNSLEGWTKQESDIGWGVAVKDRSKTTYEQVYNMIADEPVTWLNGTFYNCVNMTTMPMLPSNIRHTDYLFFNCKSLQSAILPSGITTLGTGMFYNCISLQYVYIPETVTHISKNGFKTFTASLSETEIMQSCQTANKISFPSECTSNAGHKFSIAPDNGILACQKEEFYFISATAPNYITVTGSGNYLLRSEGSNGHSLWVFWYNKTESKWEQIIDYAGGYTDIIPSSQNSKDPLVFTEIIYTSHDLYKDDDKNILFRKADVKNSFLNGVYYGYKTELYSAFEGCNPSLKIYCEHESESQEFEDVLKEQTIIYNTSFSEMIEIKYNEFKGI